MTNSKRTVLAALAAALLAAGCAPQPSGPATRPTGVVLDACADALHELEGQLLLYYVKNQHLPETLAELDAKNPHPACPVTKQPYIYRPEGIQVRGVEGRIIVWEKTSCRPGVRWVMAMLPPTEGQGLHLNVIPVPVKPAK